jgi:hypothetical protein
MTVAIQSGVVNGRASKHANIGILPGTGRRAVAPGDGARAVTLKGEASRTVPELVENYVARPARAAPQHTRRARLRACEAAWRR